MNTDIQIRGLEPVTSIEIAADITRWRDGAITTARRITAVSTPEEQAAAVASVRSLKEIGKRVEDTRKRIKAPVLQLGKDLDSAASIFCAPIEVETERVQRLITGYQIEQDRLAREAEAARQRELQRIERERQEAERKARDEADAAARKAQSLEDLDAAARREDEAKRQADLSARQQTAVAIAPVAPPPRASGMVVRRVQKFRVLDILALANARPDLVRMEPNTSAILAALKRGEALPQVEAWEETETGVRV